MTALLAAAAECAPANAGTPWSEVVILLAVLAFGAFFLWLMAS